MDTERYKWTYLGVRAQKHKEKDAFHVKDKLIAKYSLSYFIWELGMEQAQRHGHRIGAQKDINELISELGHRKTKKWHSRCKG